MEYSALTEIVKEDLDARVQETTVIHIQDIDGEPKAYD